MLRVQSTKKIEIKIASVFDYKYNAELTETWRDGHLVNLNGNVNNNGSILQWEVMPRKKGVMIISPGKRRFMRQPVATSIGWNFLEMSECYPDLKLIVLKNGNVFHPKIKHLPDEELIINGKKMKCRHLELMDRGDVHMWFDSQGIMVKYQTKVDGYPLVIFLDKRR